MGERGWRRSLALLLAASGILWVLPIPSALAAVPGANAIVLENQQPGTSAWRLRQPGFSVGDDIAGQIKGYASATSVNKGESLTFYVSVSPVQAYSLDVYRLGWYQGLGGRLMQHLGPLNGVSQPACPVDASTGLIECAWAPGPTLDVPTTWTSGVFVGVLTNAANVQNAIVFTVRDDTRNAPLLVQQAVATYQAYNNYPDDRRIGKSVYESSSYGANTVVGTRRAVKVSFDRPYARDGMGQLLSYDINLIRWLELSGYDVSYSTDVDTHAHAVDPRAHRGLLVMGHDEYWSKEMFDTIEGARDSGVNVAFVGANEAYRQIRFEPSSSGVSNRVVVCYKSSIDPVKGPTMTVDFRAAGRPEQSMIGVAYTSVVAVPAPFVVTESDSWFYWGTGFRDGDQVPGLVGGESDRMRSEYPGPVARAVSVLSRSPFTTPPYAPDYSQATLYQAPGGAWVFAAGTFFWSWALDDFGAHGVTDARIQRATTNLLDRFVASPAGGLTPALVSEPTISISDLIAAEGAGTSADAVFTIALSAPAPQAISVRYATADDTAKAPADYAQTSGTLDFAIGEQVHTVSVPVVPDDVSEGTEGFRLNLSSAVGAGFADTQGVATILDDDAPLSFSVDDPVFSEGNAASTALFTVSLSKTSVKPVSMTYATASLTATTADYTAVSGTLTFAAGERTKAIAVAIIGDTVSEGPEMFALNVNALSGASAADSQGRATILDDDGPVGISVNDPVLLEGNAQITPAIFTVSLSNPSTRAVTVSYQSADVSATVASGDYTAVQGSLTFAPGEQSKQVQVPIAGDTVSEGNEILALNLSALTAASYADAQGRATLIDDDGPISLSVSDQVITEGDTATTDAVFTVSLSNPTTRVVTATYQTQDSTATVADSDYTAVSGSLRFAPGEVTKTIAVPVVGDRTYEGTDVALLRLSTVIGASGADVWGALAIVNDDPIVRSPIISSGPAAASPSSAASFAISDPPAGGSLACRLDPSDFSPCVSPAAYSSLPDGPYRFDVKAVDRDANESAVTSYSWTVDTQPPGQPALFGPSGPIANSSAEFVFSDADPTAAFSCTLDGVDRGFCTSPTDFTGLSEAVHAFSVVAVDAAGNQSPVATLTWTVDLTPPPVPTIVTAPAAATNENPSQVAFSDSETVDFFCQVDAAARASCVSPVVLADLVEGAHEFRVIARDAAMNESAAALVSWTVDRTAPPRATISSAPAALTNTTDAQFAFADTEDGVTFACTLDGGVAAACTSPVTFTGLAEGSHTFAIDASDAAHNTATTSFGWTVDLTPPPDPQITSGPDDPSSVDSADFVFSDTETGVQFLCRIDASPQTECASPMHYGGLLPGPHRFAVVARDAALNTSSSASLIWTIL